MSSSQPPFTLESVSLLSVDFKRTDELYAATDKVENVLQIGLSRTSDAPLLSVILQVDLTQQEGENKLLTITARTSGEFRVAEGVDTTTIDHFADINAPAIIFPFVRELFASLTARAGIPTVLVQPLNFVDMAERRKNTQIQEP